MRTFFNPILYYTLIVSLGGFIFGFDASVISGAIGFIVTEFELSAWEQGFVVGSPTLGGLIATLSAGAICDAFGRRKTLLIIAFLYLVSAVASALAVDYWMLVTARFIGGMAFCSLMIAPIYIAEISPAEDRGKMVSINQLNIVLGFAISYFSNFYFLKLSQSQLDWVTQFGLSQNVWRWMLGMEIVPALLWFALLFLIPRSPRWLMLHQHESEAISVVNKLFSKKQAIKQLEEIQQSLKVKISPINTRLKELFSQKLRFAIFIGFILAVAQQVTGINVIIFYAPSVFEQSGVGTNAAFMQAVWLGVVNVIFTLLAMWTIDKYGRKPLLLIGLIGITVSMAVCALGFYQASYQLSSEDIQLLSDKLPPDTLTRISTIADQSFHSDVTFKKTLIDLIGETQMNLYQGKLLEYATTMNAKLILFGILSFVAFFAMSLGPVMWVMFSEIFPNHLRGLAVSLVGVFNSAVSFLVQFIYPWEIANFGAAMTFLTFGIFAFAGFILVLIFVPETRGRSLEELEQLFTLGRAKRYAKAFE